MSELGKSVLEGKKILITGACGFIGSHLVKRLVKLGGRISVIDRKSSNPWRIEGELEHIQIWEEDITNYSGLEACIKEISPDYVFHLAAYGVDSSQGDYFKASQTNIMGIINILSALKGSGCEKVINIGSCAEYGNRREPMHEDMCPLPVSIYGSTKACATIMAHQLGREKDIDIVTLRPFGVFGESEDRHKVFCHIILSILENRGVMLTPCEQYRDYCYVENIIDGMIMVAVNRDIKNEVFNIASGIVYPLKYYVNLIFKFMETEKKPMYGGLEYRLNELWSPVANIDKIRAQVGWTARVGIEDGIRNTIAWYRSNWEKYSK